MLRSSFLKQPVNLACKIIIIPSWVNHQVGNLYRCINNVLLLREEQKYMIFIFGAVLFFSQVCLVSIISFLSSKQSVQ